MPLDNRQNRPLTEGESTHASETRRHTKHGRRDLSNENLVNAGGRRRGAPSEEDYALEEGGQYSILPPRSQEAIDALEDVLNKAAQILTPELDEEAVDGKGKRRRKKADG